MTLVIAKKICKKFVIVSDCYLTPSVNISNSSYVRNYTNDEKITSSTIKTYIINNEISISFAGDFYLWEKTVNEIKDFTCIDNLLSILKKYSADDKIEFIVCIGNPYFTMLKINQGNVVESKNQTETFHIGSSEGFNVFQKHFNSEYEETAYNNETNLKIIKEPNNFSNSDYLIYKKTLYAFEKVIESNIKDVSDFTIPVAYDDSSFEYMSYVYSYKRITNKEIVIPKIDNDLFYYDDLGKSEDGDYTINFLCTTNKAVAIYFPLEKKGMVYERNHKGIMLPKTYSKEEIEFFEILKQKKLIVDKHYSFLFDHQVGNILRKADTYYNLLEYEKAIKYYNIIIGEILLDKNEIEKGIENSLLFSEYKKRVHEKDFDSQLIEVLKYIFRQMAFIYYIMSTSLNNNDSQTNLRHEYIIESLKYFKELEELDSNYFSNNKEDEKFYFSSIALSTF